MSTVDGPFPKLPYLPGERGAYPVKPAPLTHYRVFVRPAQLRDGLLVPAGGMPGMIPHEAVQIDCVAGAMHDVGKLFIAAQRKRESQPENQVCRLFRVFLAFGTINIRTPKVPCIVEQNRDPLPARGPATVQSTPCKRDREAVPPERMHAEEKRASADFHRIGPSPAATARA